MLDEGCRDLKAGKAIEYMQHSFSHETNQCVVTKLSSL